MRWQMGRRSSNIEDRRGMGGGRFPVRAAGGIGGLGAIAVIVIGLFLGVDPAILLDVAGGGGGVAPYDPGPGFDSDAETAANPDEQRLKEMVAVVLADTEDTWNEILPAVGRAYEEPTLVLFSGAVDSACGFAEAATGPFYCPGDRKVYLDLSFFGELGQRFGAPGDFAQAYVVAHEVGHHVQTLLGISAEVRRYQQGADRAAANAASVRLELQADCFAGVWAYHADKARGLLESGDVEEGLAAAAAVGDDRMQRQAGRRISPESFTHGSAEQRQRWFEAGFETGSPASCDTFKVAEP